MKGHEEKINTLSLPNKDNQMCYNNLNGGK